MDTANFVSEASTAVAALERLITPEAPTAFKDACKGMTVAEVVALQQQLGIITDRASSMKSELQKLYDFARFTLVPGVMEEADIESAKIDGVGRVCLASDINVSVRAGKAEEAQVWLVENGYGDLIKETVNSSSLKALVRSMMKKGEEVPADIFNVSAFTRAQITKS